MNDWESPKRDALVKKLEDTDHCPVCNGTRWKFEEFAPGVHDFVAEASFHCGARVQVEQSDPDEEPSFTVAAGCEESLASAMQDLETDVEDALEAA